MKACKFEKGRTLVMPRTQWDGKSAPRSYSAICGEEKNDVSVLFREQMEFYKRLWSSLPPLAICRLFWKSARVQAHAAFTFDGHVPEFRYVAF